MVSDSATISYTSYLRNVDLLVLVFVKVSLHKLFKVLEAHLPRFALSSFHIVESLLAESRPYVLLKPVVQESTAA